MKSKLIIITGASAAGKTTLLKRILMETNIMGFSKDEFKERLFDSVENLDLELSKALGLASFNLIFDLVEKFAHSKVPLIIEANFRPRYNEKDLNETIKKYQIDVMQILCEADADIMLDRLIKRKETGERHDKHFDLGRDEEFKAQVENGDYRFFDIKDKKRIEINTNEFSDSDQQKVIDEVKDFLISV